MTLAEEATSDRWGYCFDGLEDFDRALIYPTVTQTLRKWDALEQKKHYRDDPVLWARERAGLHLWSKQAEAARLVAANHDVAIKAAFGVGKSFLAAVLIVWWVDTRYPADLFVASTAPSTAQVSAIVWRNIRQIVERVNEIHPDDPVPGYITSQNEWKVGNGKVIGYGRKPADQNAGNTFQGIHATEGVLAVGDEAVSLPEPLIAGLQKITSNSASRRFLICNPTDPASYVASLFENEPENWTLFTISALDLPSFTGEEVPAGLEGLTDASFVDAIRIEYGEDSPQWKIMVLGEFADSSLNVLFTQETLARAFDAEKMPTGLRPVLGVDVARFGDDSSVVYQADHGYVRLLDSWKHAPATETANRIHRLALDSSAREVRIDGAGLGGPIVDMVVQLAEGKYVVRSMIGNAASPDRRRWFNWRAWAYDSVRAMMRRDEIDMDFEDENLRKELGKISYEFRNGGLLLESKESMRGRGIKSPDYADAFLYAAVSDEMIEMPQVGTGFIEHSTFLDPDETLWDVL